MKIIGQRDDFFNINCYSIYRGIYMSKKMESEYIKSETGLILDRLNEVIHNSGFTIGEIADEAEVSQNQLYKYLNGTNAMPFNRFIAIVDLIGADKAYVIFGKHFDKNSGVFLDEDIFGSIRNLKLRIEEEVENYTEEEKRKYISYFLEIGLLLNK